MTIIKPEFTHVEREDWGVIDIRRQSGASGFWRAMLWVQIDPGDSPTGRPGHLQFTTEGLNPDEAMARLEQAVIETLAVGGQLNERRHGFGRREYDDGYGRHGGSRQLLGAHFDRRTLKTIT